MSARDVRTFDEPGPDPGLDLHEWTSIRASIDDETADDVAAGLSQLADLVQRMLVASGYELDDPVARGGAEPELVATYVAARETAERSEVGTASRAEMTTALEDLRALFDTLVETRPA